MRVGGCDYGHCQAGVCATGCLESYKSERFGLPSCCIAALYPKPITPECERSASWERKQLMEKDQNGSFGEFWGRKSKKPILRESKPSGFET